MRASNTLLLTKQIPSLQVNTLTIWNENMQVISHEISFMNIRADRRCKYGGDDEYFLEVRETSNRQQERINTEQQIEEGKDRTPFELAKCRMIFRASSCSSQ